jgi:hypothetical protein
MPGTIEDFMFNAEDSKMKDIQQVTQATRQAEQAVRYGDSEARAGVSRNFTRSQKRKAGAKPKLRAVPPNRPKHIVSIPAMPTSLRATGTSEVAATDEKSIKYVVILGGNKHVHK